MDPQSPESSSQVLLDRGHLFEARLGSVSIEKGQSAVGWPWDAGHMVCDPKESLFWRQRHDEMWRCPR